MNTNLLPLIAGLARRAWCHGAARCAEVEVSDDSLMRLLSEHVPPVPQTDLAIGRQRLLTAVAMARAASPSGAGERTLIGKLLTARALAALAAAGIFAGSAATVGASGGVSGAAGNVQNVLAALHVTDRTPDQADAHLEDVSQPDGSGKPADVGATPGAGLQNAAEHADDYADHGLQNAAEGGANAGEGIDNAAQQGLDHADSHALDGPASGSTPAAALPPQANEHAEKGAGNAAEH